jgi:hypothetical protein
VIPVSGDPRLLLVPHLHGLKLFALSISTFCGLLEAFAVGADDSMVAGYLNDGG